jgi:hypothetical protein
MHLPDIAQDKAHERQHVSLRLRKHLLSSSEVSQTTSFVLNVLSRESCRNANCQTQHFKAQLINR